MPLPLDRPPIVEALLDFRVRSSEGDTEERFAALREALRGDYPTVSAPVETEGAPAAVQALLFLRGAQRRLRSDDGRRTVLVGPDRLTLSITFRPPQTTYQNWAELEAPAFEAWEAFEAAMEPAGLESLATRFVNRIDARADRPADVFTSPPELPITNAVLSSFNDRRSGRTLDGYGVRLGRRLGARPEGRPAAVLFVDVEAFRDYDGGTPPPPIRQPSVARDLARLRQLKNDLFYGSLTPSTLDRYRDADA